MFKRRLTHIAAISGLLLASVSSAQAAHDAAPPFRVAKGLSHKVQKYSGLNWVTNASMSGVATAILMAKTRGRVHAKIRTYNFTDLLDGEFKSIEVQANSGKLNGVPFGKLHAGTQQPFKLRYFGKKNRPRGLQSPVMVFLEGDVEEGDLSRALNSRKVADNLRFLKIDLPGLGEQRLQILEPQVSIEDEKVLVDAFVITAGAAKDTGIKVRVVATPELDQERFINLRKLKVESSDIRDPENFGPFAEELLNPLIDFGRYDRLTHAFRLSKLSIKDHRVKFSGKMLLAPKPVPKAS